MKAQAIDVQQATGRILWVREILGRWEETASAKEFAPAMTAARRGQTSP
jgi:hypothetical protein